jgi:hypothetical protein
VADDENAMSAGMVGRTVRAVAVGCGWAGEDAGDEQKRECAGEHDAGADAGDGHACTQYACRRRGVKEW